MEYYLGIAALGNYNAAAALVNECGEAVAAAEEERYTRIKYDPSFPLNSIKFCLEKAGITLNDVKEIGYYFDPSRYRKERMMFGLKNMYHFPDLFRKTIKFAKFGSIEAIISKTLSPRTPISLIPHHLCHASSVFFASPFHEATIVSIDGAGEWETAWIGYGKGEEIFHLESILWPHSLGMVYSAFTQLLGFNYYSDQYKVMGLAAYGSPLYYEQMKDIIHISADGKFTVDTSYFRYPHGSKLLYNKKCEELFGDANDVFIDPTDRDKNLAASLQKRLEDCFLEYVKRAVKLTGIRNICLVGGVALNCLAVGRLIKNGEIADSVFLGPASSDAGCALGAAYYLASTRSNIYRRTPLKNALLGNSYNDDEIRRALEKQGISYENCGEEIGGATARLIAEGKIVGWFQGRTEYGQRALGARSILANPTIASMKNIVNEKVKYRELFRPLAPSVLLEDADKYFECHGQTSPFMTHVFPAKQGIREKLPAVIHNDGTARVQTVSQDENQLYYEMIKRVGEETGYPVVLNTSFNIKDEPIVNSPENAINCFLKTELDALVIGEYLVRKK